MARPIWTGTVSFGLLNVPVSLVAAERKVDLHFRMLDSRSNTPIRYERVNAETGDEVPWKDTVKAFEYDKGNYVVLKPEDIKSAAPESHETVEMDAFVDAAAITPDYYEKPYYLVPAKKADKGYVLLRETLRATGKIGIGKVVVRTREYLCAVMPRGPALMLMILRYPQELVDASDYHLPEGKASEYRITSKELDMAKQLVLSMAAKWKPGDYRDEFRERLKKVIEKRLKSKGVVAEPQSEGAEPPPDSTTNVVDFMSLLKKSLASKQRTPARNSAGTDPAKSLSKVVGKTAARRKPSRKRKSA